MPAKVKFYPRAPKPLTSRELARSREQAGDMFPLKEPHPEIVGGQIIAQLDEATATVVPETTWDGLPVFDKLFYPKGPETRPTVVATERMWTAKGILACGAGATVAEEDFLTWITDTEHRGARPVTNLQPIPDPGTPPQPGEVRTMVPADYPFSTRQAAQAVEGKVVTTERMWTLEGRLAAAAGVSVSAADFALWLTDTEHKARQRLMTSL